MQKLGAEVTGSHPLGSPSEPSCYFQSAKGPLQAALNLNPFSDYNYAGAFVGRLCRDLTA